MLRQWLRAWRWLHQWRCEHEVEYEYDCDYKFKYEYVDVHLKLHGICSMLFEAYGKCQHEAPVCACWRALAKTRVTRPSVPQHHPVRLDIFDSDTAVLTVKINRTLLGTWLVENVKQWRDLMQFTAFKSSVGFLEKITVKIFVLIWLQQEDYSMGTQGALLSS